MRISEIKGEKTLDVLADLIPPFARIAKDARVRDAFARKKVPKGTQPIEFFLGRVEENAPVLLKSHRDDIVLILATLNEKTVDEYLEGLNPITLLNDLLGILNDNELGDFLPLSETSAGDSPSTDS